MPLSLNPSAMTLMDLPSATAFHTSGAKSRVRFSEPRFSNNRARPLAAWGKRRTRW